MPLFFLCIPSQSSIKCTFFNSLKYEYKNSVEQLEKRLSWLILRISIQLLCLRSMQKNNSKTHIYFGMNTEQCVCWKEKNFYEEQLQSSESRNHPFDRVTTGMCFQVNCEFNRNAEHKLFTLKCLLAIINLNVNTHT